jgi:hypothetical protein
MAQLQHQPLGNTCMSNSVLARAFVGLATAMALAIVVSIWPLPARATDPTFPPGSRIGLVPPPGMMASERFAGFVDPNANAAILITVLPADAYEHVTKSLDPEALKKQGIVIDKREPMQLSTGKAFLVVGHQVAGKESYRKWLLVAAAGDLTALVSVQIPEHDSVYPDAVVRAALETLAVRARVPQEEELRLLPFTVGDLAGFKVAAVLPGRAIVLADLPPESKNAAKGAGQGAAQEPAKDTAKEPAKDTAKEPAKDTAKEPAKDTAKEPAKEPAKKAADQPLTARLLIAAMPGGPSEFDDRVNFARLNFNEIAGINDIHDTTSEPMRISGQAGYQILAHAKDERTGADVTVVQWLRFGANGFLQLTAIAPADQWANAYPRLRAVRDSVEPK